MLAINLIECVGWASFAHSESCFSGKALPDLRVSYFIDELFFKEILRRLTPINDKYRCRIKQH